MLLSTLSRLYEVIDLEGLVRVTAIIIGRTINCDGFLAFEETGQYSNIKED